MASRGSRTRQSKRARSSGLSTAAPGDSKEPERCSDTLQSSQKGNGKGKQVENAFNFFQDLPADVLGEVRLSWPRALQGLISVPILGSSGHGLPGAR